MSIKGKIALVTGASRGIGLAITQLLVERGVKVFGTATSKKGVKNIDDYLGEKGKGFILNVADSISINNLMEDIKNIYGKYGVIDILINNAGITADNLLMSMKNEQWQNVLDTNLTSIFYLSKAVLKAMIKKRFGRIITIGSVVGTTGNAGQVNYAATKAGIVGFSKSLAHEVATRGITVNVVAPGFIETDMTEVLTEKQREYILTKIPANRFGSAKEVASAVVFLASAEASYISGETLHVNGGMYMF
ncbi:3-oxoacyl-ACP reductase FabG [Candidatus Fukatsuia anoeciicola]|uniref:3-oxoacyl-ACP reductase FabG n=1 Tax=Candidatus Fukatsuia anoeciicola TaxID=2994492 RepID=UPI003463E6C7